MITIPEETIKKVALECFLINQLPSSQIEVLLNASSVIDVKENQILTKENQTADAFYLVLCGEFKVAKVSPKGIEKILHIIQPRETFATVLMFLENPVCPVTITALMDSKVLAIPSKLYKSMLAKSPEACFRLLADFAQRNRQLIDEIESVSLKNANYRVIDFLVKQSTTSADGKTTIKLRISKQTIAARLSIKPETLSRILTKLKKDSVIEQNEKCITINELKWMQTYLEGE